MYSRLKVVDDVTDPKQEISLEEAKAIDPNYAIGDIVEEEVTPKDFGRIAAQTAKQVVIQRIREAERSIIFNEYANRAGDVVNGIIQRIDHRNVIIDLGKVEAVLPVSEQIPGERYEPNQRMKFYINEVKQSSRGPQIFLSRTHPGLLKYLFELEVPEIQSGVVEIKSVAREAGSRSKIAVFSRDENVDPVGACVGSKGMRVQAVVSQLNGEKIDIVAWVPDEVQFIANALSPAAVIRVILDEVAKTARVVAPDDQLSLAIGKEGQNARLAARLTGWKIDIKSETQAEDEPLFQVQMEPEVDEGTRETGSPELEADSEIEETAVESDSLELDEEPAESETPASEESVDEVAALLAKLSSSNKRKSWEERFGSVSLSDENTPTKSESETEPEKPKQKKKKEKVIKDFSMLSLEDFQFDEED